MTSSARFKISHQLEMLAEITVQMLSLDDKDHNRKLRIHHLHVLLFELYFTNELVSSIVSCANKKIRRTLSIAEDLIAQNSRYSYMKETTVEEMYAFIGLYLYRGLYKLNTLSVDKMFSNQYGPPIFSATMSRNRFVFIRANLCFDDKTTRGERWKHDHFAAMRNVFKTFNYECMSCLVPVINVNFTQKNNF